MLEQRIIACLDVKNGQVVKGVQFKQHEVVGEILPLAKKYAAEGADELVFYDITASVNQRLVDKTWVKQIAEQISIPFTVAGGIQSVAQAKEVLAMGATKISVNSPALNRPELINELVAALGSDQVVIGIDSFFNKTTGNYEVLQFTGDETKTQTTPWLTLDWIREVIRRGAGEIVLNCMNQDGMRNGYDIKQLQATHAVCTVPLVASGGAGNMAHIQSLFEQTKVEGALIASALHKNLIQLPKLRAYLKLPTLAWEKMKGLLPCVVQNAQTGQLLMQGYMNQAAAEQSLNSGQVTFFSRSKKRLWVKGEASGHTLQLVELLADCDQDALLVLAIPQGPTCHLGTPSCWPLQNELAFMALSELTQLEQTITQRKLAQGTTANSTQTDSTQTKNKETSYTAQLFAEGIQRCAQKVGEEGVEVALAAVAQRDRALLEESADLIYHLMVLLQARGLSLAEVCQVLKLRRKPNKSV